MQLFVATALRPPATAEFTATKNTIKMKNALILGGSTGMGLDIAKRLGASGAAVTIAGRDLKKLDAAAAQIKRAGAAPVAIKSIDLYDRAQVDAYVRDITQGPA
ncbi:MAG TPA: SDR family NAD(P)-dependent oxidoreductase, partial [Opitutaceae bacterium]|nr:SDR family NAD(P)-dependent oxidoreductase [Opitutaceae bacterium]